MLKLERTHCVRAVHSDESVTLLGHGEEDGKYKYSVVETLTGLLRSEVEFMRISEQTEYARDPDRKTLILSARKLLALSDTQILLSETFSSGTPTMKRRFSCFDIGKKKITSCSKLTALNKTISDEYSVVSNLSSDGMLFFVTKGEEQLETDRLTISALYIPKATTTSTDVQLISSKQKIRLKLPYNKGGTLKGRLKAAFSLSTNDERSGSLTGLHCLSRFALSLSIKPNLLPFPMPSSLS